ncbi:ATP-binding protein [uncultured Cohaesibacter sp.]|uniref:ATP-binding protein n=1 Tax=uncultured Cohaesibacter sp. TaxID=1002546 RepID=UPI002AA656B8|nr:ATP-binding protein [uncultured Cohaesibacter sp.]
MQTDESYLGEVQDVNGTTVSLAMSSKSLTGFVYIDGQGYRAGQVGSFVRIPIGFDNLFGIVSKVGASAIPESKANELDVNNRWMTVQLIGEGPKNGSFQRGLSQYPTIGDPVHLVSEKELKGIYGQPDKPYFVKLGHVSNAESIPALVDVNKLITRHSVVVGTTGSGKSTTVASLMNALSDRDNYPSARIIMLDLHGEYGRALSDRASIFRISPPRSTQRVAKSLWVPFWALSFDELEKVAFGEFGNEKDRNFIMERVLKYKLESFRNNPRAGLTEDTLNADSPVPFNIHGLWYELFLETFATFYPDRDGEPIEKLAYDTDADGNELKGDPSRGIPPQFKHVVRSAGVEKVQYIPNSNQMNIGKQIQLLGTKLRIPRYDYIFKPGKFHPNGDGEVEQDLDELLKSWIGSQNPISILDLSGVPSDTLKTTINVLLRLLYDAMFWSRSLSQGGRHRPLLVVMEEAHIYLNHQTDSAASQIVNRIVKEGRKYGVGAMIVSQRPSEIDPTVLSQCGTFFALRLANAKDRSQVSSAMSDNLDGLTGMLPILRTGEAIILGESVKLPMRTTITPPPPNKRPDSQDPIVFDEVPLDETLYPGGWGISMENDPNYEEMVETWRAQNPQIGRLIKE